MTMVSYMSFFDPGAIWQIIALLATMCVMLVYIVLYMFGRAFMLDELERFAKSEMLQAAATFVMLAFFIMIVMYAQKFAIEYFFGSTVQDPTNQNIYEKLVVTPRDAGTGEVVLPCGTEPKTISSIESSLDLLQCRMKENAKSFAKIYDQLMDAAKWPYFYQSIYVAMIGAPIIQGGYMTDVYMEIETYRLLQNMTIHMLIATNVVMIMTDFIKNNALSLFLPLGLILRGFSATRSIGSFFIALAIGFYFVFPILYIISDPAYVRPTNANLLNPPLSSNFACYPTYTGLVYQLTAAPTMGLGPIGGELSLDALKNDMSSIYFTVILYPFVIASVTLVFVRQMMSLLGGESQDLLRLFTKVV